MKQEKLNPSSRIDFFDNLRYLMVLLVLIFHSGASYTAMVSFWPFHEENTSNFVEIFTILVDTFNMTILFFIAGYFALPSLVRKGGKDYLASRFKRLGVPWLVITIFILPILDYIHYANQILQTGLQPHKYGTHWLLSMQKIAEFKFGYMNMSTSFDMTQHFYQRYMWFLSLLLLFLLVFCLIYEANRKWSWSSVNRRRDGKYSDKPVQLVLAVVGLLSILLFSGAKILSSSLTNPTDLVWLSLGNILQFQAAKLAFYIPAFCFGIYAHSRNWFLGDKDLGSPGNWGWAVFILMIANLFIGKTMTRTVTPSLVLQILFLLLYPLWTLSFLGFFVSLGSKRWNVSSRLDKSLAAESYNMYLVHYIFVMIIPLLINSWSLGPLVKFGIVSLVTIILSYLVSHYLIKPYPKFTVAGVIVVNLGLFLFL